MGDVVILLGMVAAVALLVLVLVVYLWRTDRARSQARIEALLQDRERDVADARRESVLKSRSSLKGQIAEQMAPLLPGFRYRPADARFLGDPIDYVVFNGYSDLRDGVAPGRAGGAPGRDGAADGVADGRPRAEGAGLEIVLLEVKQGGSALSPFQRMIASSVQEGRVRFEVLRISDDGTLSSEAWRPRRAPGPRELP